MSIFDIPGASKNGAQLCVDVPNDRNVNIPWVCAKIVSELFHVNVKTLLSHRQNDTMYCLSREITKDHHFMFLTTNMWNSIVETATMHNKAEMTWRLVADECVLIADPKTFQHTYEIGIHEHEILTLGIIRRFWSHEQAAVEAVRYYTSKKRAVYDQCSPIKLPFLAKEISLEAFRGKTMTKQDIESRMPSF